jgi:hypothetical protein
MMFTTRCWGSTTALLCTLLFQNCQLHSLRATEEEEPAASSSSASAVHQGTSSVPAMRPLTSLDASLAAHVSPFRLSTNPASKEDRSAAPSCCLLSPSTLFTPATMSNSPAAPYDLPAAAMPRAYRVMPLSNMLGRVPSPNDPRVCMSKVEEVLREMPGGEEEDSKPFAKQRSTNLDDGFTRKKARAGERREYGDIRRDVLDTLLAMAGSEPDKAVALPAFLGPAAQRDQALDNVANASLAMSYSPQTAVEKWDKDVRLLALKTLGEVEWQHYFGEVEPAPDLPSDMDDILDSECPFWPGRKVRDTHLLVLIPAKVNGQLFSLNLLRELIQHPNNGGYKTQYRYYGGGVQAQLGASSPAASYWLLMTRDVLPESRGKSCRDQQKLIAGHARRTNMPYELPKVLEAATAILTHHVRNGERLYGDRPWTYTRCQEWVLHQSNKYPAVVGGFESSGLEVLNHDYVLGSVGVAGCRKFF